MQKPNQQLTQKTQTLKNCATAPTGNNEGGSRGQKSLAPLEKPIEIADLVFCQQNKITFRTI